MTTIPISNLELIEENTDDSGTGHVFMEIRRDMGLPFVPNLFRTTANSAVVLAGTWQVFSILFMRSTLPVALKAMIMYSIAAAKECAYCSAVHQVTCKNIGVDEETIKNLTQNLQAINPKRVQAIIGFATQVAQDAQSLTEEDYDRVRDQGVSEEELTEIIGIAALGNYLDTLADAFKIDLDSAIKEALRS